MVLDDKAVVKILKKMDKKYHDDQHRAAEEALIEIRRLGNYAEIAEKLIFHGVLEMIYDVRGWDNKKRKRRMGIYPVPAPKVKVGKSEYLREANLRDPFLLNIDHRHLGDILGKELLGVAARLRSQANGTMQLAELCETLAPLVPPEKKVSESRFLLMTSMNVRSCRSSRGRE